MTSPDSESVVVPASPAEGESPSSADRESLGNAPKEPALVAASSPSMNATSNPVTMEPTAKPTTALNTHERDVFAAIDPLLRRQDCSSRNEPLPAPVRSCG